MILRLQFKAVDGHTTDWHAAGTIWPEVERILSKERGAREVVVNYEDGSSTTFKYSLT